YSRQPVVVTTSRDARKTSSLSLSMILSYRNVSQVSSITTTRSTRISRNHRRTRIGHRSITLYLLEHQVWCKPEVTKVSVVPAERSTRNILLIPTGLVHDSLNL